MIVLFSVANFRSFSSEETFSLVASEQLSTSHQTHLIPIPDTTAQVLKTSVLYGANGAGKSNLFQALNYLKILVLKPRQKNSSTGRDVFRFAENTSEQPSRFDLQFITQGKLYRFGCAVTDKNIIEEWLVQVIGEQEKVVYERITNEDGKVTIEANEVKNNKKLEALVTIGGPHNQTFLATIRATLNKADYSEEISDVLTWFEKNLTLIAPDASFASLAAKLANDSVFREFAGTFLKASDTGVETIKTQKQEITEETLHSLLPETLVSDLLNDVADNEEGKAFVQIGTDKELLIERSDKNHYYSLTIQSFHKNNNEKSISLDLSDESDGTRRLLNLMPVLHDLNNNSVCFIDEIDRSLHPMLVWKFLEFFLKSSINIQCQIIVTTHESNLLNLDLLRRDEIWFAEKDTNGATHLYSLSDFKPRKDLDIRKHYLQGRFSAIPFLSNFEHLLEEKK